jgi:hypothetical protein
LLDFVPDAEARLRLRLAVRRSTEEVVFRAARGMLVARQAHAGETTWLMLHECSGKAPAGDSTEPLAPGREPEMALFMEHLQDEASAVLHVWGPLGIGKTTLLRAFEAKCEALKCPCFVVDARTASPDEETIFALLTGGAGSCSSQLDRTLRLSRRLGCTRWVLLIDNLDAWEDRAPTAARLLRSLPEDCRIVVSTRQRPGAVWNDLTARPLRVLALSALSEQASVDLALRFGLSRESARDVARSAGGHPLSIRLLAETVRFPVLAHSPLSVALPLDEDVLRAVLEPASIPARITQEVLDALLDDPSERGRAYEVLRTVCLPDPSGMGLCMPVAIRSALHARLRERSPARYLQLRRSLVARYASMLESASPSEAYPILDDFFDTFDDLPALRRLVGSSLAGLPRVRRATIDDEPALFAFARRALGEEAAKRLARRLRDARARTLVAEDAGAVCGIAQYVLTSVSALVGGAIFVEDPEADAGAQALRLLRDLPEADLVLFSIAWATLDHEERSWGPTACAMYRAYIKLMLATPRCVATVFVKRRGQYLATQEVMGSREVEVGDVSAVVRDLRGISPAQILRVMAEADEERATYLGSTAAAKQDLRWVTPDVVREALSAVLEPRRLVSSPLLALRAVERQAGPGASPDAKAAALAELLRGAVASLKGGPRSDKVREVLTMVFLERSGKHEVIALSMGLPYGTFRRYLARGVEEITTLLRAGDGLADSTKLARSAAGQR